MIFYPDCAPLENNNQVLLVKNIRIIICDNLYMTIDYFVFSYTFYTALAELLDRWYSRNDGIKFKTFQSDLFSFTY